MSKRCHTIQLKDAQATCQLAKEIGPRLRSGDVLLLWGEIGAGKTHFARCLIQACLAIPEEIPSPTYTLVQVYSGVHADIWHADLYRINDASDAVELGLHDAFCDSICLVEWPEKLGDLSPASALSLSFENPDGDDSRQLTLSWEHPDWSRKLKGIVFD